MSCQNKSKALYRSGEQFDGQFISLALAQLTRIRPTNSNQCIQTHSDTFRYIQIHSDAFRYIQIHSNPKQSDTYILKELQIRISYCEHTITKHIIDRLHGNDDIDTNKKKGI